MAWLMNLGGGALMGVGTALAHGGNDALVLYGIPILSPYALPTFAALALGAAAGLLAMRRWFGIEARVVCRNDTFIADSWTRPFEPRPDRAAREKRNRKAGKAHRWRCTKSIVAPRPRTGAEVTVRVHLRARRAVLRHACAYALANRGHEVRLQGTGIAALVGQRKPAGVAQHGGCALNPSFFHEQLSAPCRGR
jgi:hypothetical protein